ncbi:hypothetical protein [Paracoccus seriniphilus]|uniref:Uncharacterized protein n=2 Tax=Paracoccus seriniphilus TaxID=184748 RepID=A0A239PS27_9RHOB|nr:hypothetical protein [Paracoccus seriniphilus]WCR15135.1 hypothetical protein JHW44_01660 [Paracoccus seriniphilus]SNT73104.1 hypothetical protein SAMN05444959_104276 [Paracoccus seriniphilus]
MFNKIALAVVATAIVAGCSPKNFESDPVTVDTPQGPVVCQLYTRGLGDWDRSISHPDGMSVKAADQICIAEGQRQLKG